MPSSKKNLVVPGRLSERIPGQLPAYQRIQSVIRKRIDSGQLQPGDAVPSERDLAKTHHVSLMTARHALAFLEREGLVERRRGIGTFVAQPKIHFNKLMSYTEQMSARTLTAGARVLFAKIVNDENEAAGEPFALETCYLNSAEFSGLIEAPIARESLFAILERDFKVELGYADEEVDATAADPRIAELLAIPRREPLLRIRQVIYSTKGKAIMYVLGFYRSDRHNLVIRRFR